MFTLIYWIKETHHTHVQSSNKLMQSSVPLLQSSSSRPCQSGQGGPDRPKAKGPGGKFRQAATQVLWTKLSTHANGVGP